ncbi:MAG TPA: hypothetical protein VFU94_09325, partial [Conexibacter sp.]|nr:hypothetical protein [Conexibacter sp.]
DREEHHVGVLTSRAAAERAVHLDAGLTQPCRQRAAEPARADDGAAQARKGWEGFPFQFPHGRYRSAFR